MEKFQIPPNWVFGFSSPNSLWSFVILVRVWHFPSSDFVPVRHLPAPPIPPGAGRPFGVVIEISPRPTLFVATAVVPVYASAALFGARDPRGATFPPTGIYVTALYWSCFFYRVFYIPRCCEVSVFVFEAAAIRECPWATAFF